MGQPAISVGAFVKVLKCSDSSFWYADRIGSVFPYKYTDEGDYWVIPPSGFINFICQSDGVLVFLE